MKTLLFHSILLSRDHMAKIMKREHKKNTSCYELFHIYKVAKKYGNLLYEHSTIYRIKIICRYFWAELNICKT